MDPILRDPLPYSNWVWLLGAFLIVLSVTWGASLLFAYRTHKVYQPEKVVELRALQRRRYQAKISQVQAEWEGGQMDVRDAHFALASLIRAAATEKTRVNVEVLTAEEAAQTFPEWTTLNEALLWCEDQTFPATPEETASEARVARGLALAEAVIGQ